MKSIRQFSVKLNYIDFDKFNWSPPLTLNGKWRLVNLVNCDEMIYDGVNYDGTRWNMRVII